MKRSSAIFKIILVFLVVFCFLSKPKNIQALSLSTYVSEKYTEIESGERLYFEIDIKYPENPKRKDLILNYEVEKDGKVIAQAKVLKAIETQAQFVDFIVIPDSSESGLYTLKVNVSDYEQLVTEVSTTFKVIGGKNQQLRIYFFILLGMVSLVSILVIINIVMMRRKNS